MTTIEAGDLSVIYAPEVGGSVAAFRVRRGGARVDLMRPLSGDDRARRNPIGAAMFPMVPYANRIGGNAFTFRGRRYTFEANNPPERFNVHGTGWQSVWSEQSRGRETVLSLDYDGGADAPYRYLARQSFELSSQALSITMEVENRGPVAMPFGFGEHPWFPRDPDVELRFSAETFWLEGWDHEATERIATPPELGFFDWKRLPAKRRNNCYGNWNGLAEICWPARGVGLKIDADPVFRHLMLYCDPAMPVFCLEPQTNATSAFDMLDEDLGGYDLGVIVLEPGALARGGMRFTPFALG